MLQVKKGAVTDRMSYAMWFALGVAYFAHSLYQTDNMVITLHERGNPEAPEVDGRVQRVKLRTSDLREFDANHWAAVVFRRLRPMGYLVYRELQHLVIEFNPSRVKELYEVITQYQSTDRSE